MIGKRLAHKKITNQMGKVGWDEVFPTKCVIDTNLQDSSFGGLMYVRILS
jgi:hypothetical protein